MLNTTSEIAFTSPLAAILRDKQVVPRAEVEESVGLADLSGEPIWHVRGRDVASAFANAPSQISEVVVMDDGLIAKPRGDQYFFINTNPDVESSSDGNSVLTVTDMTHGYGHLLLMGQRAADVLPKVCGMDFSDSAFPNLHIAQSSLAKVRASIIRCDRDDVLAYHILVSYPVAAYVWNVLLDAMQEFDGRYFQLN